MKIFNSFLIIMGSIVLLLMPLTSAVYDFATDLREDSFTVATGVGETSGNVTLIKPIYDDDTTTIDVISDLSTDDPLFNTYNTTSRATNFTGLTANTTRTLTVSYDVDALNAWPAVNSLVDVTAWLWLIIIICFAPAAIAAIFIGRA